MGANATLDYGALQVELKAENAEKLESELNQIITFLESNEDRFNGIFGKISPPSVENPEHDLSVSDDANKKEIRNENGPLSRIAKELRIDQQILEDIIIIDDESPELVLRDKNILGNHKTERQRTASLILLYLWEECYGVERVKTTELKNALSMSGISESNLANMYQGQGDRMFSRSGRGASATIGLRTQGEREARKVVKDLVERIDNESSESGQSLLDL